MGWIGDQGILSENRGIGKEMGSGVWSYHLMARLIPITDTDLLQYSTTVCDTILYHALSLSFGERSLYTCVTR